MGATATLTLEQGIAALASIVGAEHVSLGASGSQSINVAPADTEQIAEVSRFANANGLSVMPTGSGSKLGWGNPLTPDIELRTGRMSLVREHTWQDMTCTVQAGCTWAAMQATLQSHGQMVALDPLWPERATVGGIVACNDSGALRLKYGSLRDLIIGMTMVLADGTIAKSGGKVVKNVAGYDIHKLMTGSFGTLGIITEVNFRLHPLEEHARTWTASLPAGSSRVKQFREPLRALMNSQLVPSCVQMRVFPQECAVDVRVAGLPECLDEYGTRIREIFSGFLLGEAQESTWAARQELFASHDPMVLKVSVLPDEICPLTAEMLQWNSGSTEVVIVAQASGLMMVSMTSAPEIALSFIDRARERLDPIGGSVIVLRAPDHFRGRVDVWGPDRGALSLMREIKRRFDPNRILNPGRFVGNI
jgi:glycolate dehydrogenase FAD-binding subunit